jgi:threonine aldolase
MSDSCDLTLKDIARIADVFYIGGTKVGALCGEAIVFTHGNRPQRFVGLKKQRGGLLAKGRLLGIQFDVLFTGNLYFDIARNAIERSNELKALLASKGYSFLLDSPTNQQFVILENERMQAMREQIAFSFWEKYDETHTVVRFATGWSTTEEDLAALERVCAIQEESRE